MKWIGWIFAVPALVILLALMQSNERNYQQEKLRLDQVHEQQQANVNAILEKAEEGMPLLAKRQLEEQQKEQALIKEQRTLAEQQEQQEKMQHKLNASIEKLKDKQDTSKSDRKDNLAGIAEIQRKIRAYERANALLEEAMQTVSPKMGM